ncbi:MAG: hypothetical protein AAF518_21970 [Spirochaetota bacterium]
MDSTKVYKFKPPHEESPVAASSTSIFRYKKQFHLHGQDTQHLGGAQVCITPAPIGQVIVSIDSENIPSHYLEPFAEVVYDIAETGIYGQRPYCGFSITLLKSWEDPSLPLERHQHIWRRVSVDGLTAYQMDGVRFPRYPVLVPTTKLSAFPLSERITISYDHLDQSPSAECVGGVCLLLHPFKKFIHAEKPEIKHWFIELISGNERRSPWAMAVYESLKELQCLWTLPACSIILFNMISNPTDSSTRAFRFATQGAFEICLNSLLEE